MTNYYVLAKNLATGKIGTYRSVNFYVLEDNRKCLKFTPDNCLAFKKLEEYGIVEDSWMIRAYILAMAETEAELREKQRVTRDNPKRLSHGPTKDLRSLWKMIDRKEDKRKNDVDATNKESQASILREFRKKSNLPAHIREPMKELSQECNENSEPMTQNYAVEVLTLLQQISKEQNDMNQSIARLRMDVSALRSDIKEDIQNMKAALSDLTEKTSQLLNSSPKVELCYLLREIGTVVDDFPGCQGEAEEWERRDDEVYCGDGLYVRKKDILEIDPRDSIQKQVTAVAKLIYPSLHEYAFQPKDGQRRITDVAVHAIQGLVNIINKSPSSTHAACSIRAIREKLKHSTHNARLTGTVATKTGKPAKRSHRSEATDLEQRISAIEANLVDNDQLAPKKKRTSEHNVEGEEEYLHEEQGSPTQQGVTAEDGNANKSDEDMSDVEEYEATVNKRKLANSRKLAAILKGTANEDEDSDETQYIPV